MNYKDYNLKDFLSDEEFRNWVLKPDKHSDEFWISWIDSHPDQESLIFKAREIMISMVRDEVEVISPDERNEILKSIITNNKSFVVEHRNKTWQYLSLAAAIALLCTISYFGFVYKTIEDSNSKQTAITKIVKSNPRGTKTLIHLSDGSKVHLNVNSSITYYSTYNVERYIELDGEAFFEVIKNPANPLVVKSGPIKTKAIGTTFNVFAKDREFEVLLVEGIVEVSSEEKNIVERLEPMQKLQYIQEQGLTNIVQVLDSTDILWTKGILHFEGLPVSKVFEILQDWYDVKIQVSGIKKDVRYTAEFDKEYLTNVLHAMSVALNFDYEISGKDVEIYFKQN